MYENITLTLRYSLILLGYFLSALFFRIICDIDEMKTPIIKISENSIFSFIGLHHHKHPDNHNYRADNHIPFYLLAKEYNTPHYSPNNSNRFVRIRSGKRKVLYYLLPNYRVNPEIQNYQSIEKYKPKRQKIIFPRQFGAYPAH